MSAARGASSSRVRTTVLSRHGPGPPVTAQLRAAGPVDLCGKKRGSAPFPRFFLGPGERFQAPVSRLDVRGMAGCVAPASFAYASPWGRGRNRRSATQAAAKTAARTAPSSSRSMTGMKTPNTTVERAIPGTSAQAQASMEYALPKPAHRMRRLPRL